MIDLDKLEQDAQGATPGPWHGYTADSGDEHAWIETYYRGGHPICALNACAADVTHIANCDPQTILALVRAVRAFDTATYLISEIIAVLEVVSPDEVLPHTTDGEFDADKSAVWLHINTLRALDGTLAPFRPDGDA